MAKLGQLREEAIALTALELQTDPPIDPAMFTLVGICYPHADRPEEFWLEIGIEGDHDGIWRVEFGPVMAGAEESSAIDIEQGVAG